MASNPKTRINSDESLTKVFNKFVDLAGEVEPGLHVSWGNRKMGRTPSISLPPVVTCGGNCMGCNGKEGCAKYCYAVRMFLCYPRVARAYTANWLMYKENPGAYWDLIVKTFARRKFVRFNVSGDNPDEGYLDGELYVAKKIPSCEFLVFTKQYDFVNHACATGKYNPHTSNLHVLMSAAPGIDMPNPHGLAECHINFADPSLNTIGGRESLAYHCTGNCRACQCAGCGCFTARPTDLVLINQH